MKKHILKAEKRTIVGRKVKALRAQGKLPGTVYGNGVKSISVTVDTDAFAKIFDDAGKSGLIELSVGGDVRPVLVHDVQVHAVSGNPLHIEFHQVDLKEKVKAVVPLEFIGEAPAVVNKVGALLTVSDEVEVEALPTDLPEHIAVDMSSLADLGQELNVSDLKISSGVTVLTDPNVVIVKVGSLISREAEAEAAAEAAASEAAKAEAGTATPAEGAPAEITPVPKAPEEKKEEK